MIFWATAYLRHLEAEIAGLKLQMVHERQRAELAVDTLLRLKIGAGPITVPMLEETAAAKSAFEALLLDPEFTNAGQADG